MSEAGAVGKEEVGGLSEGAEGEDGEGRRNQASDRARLTCSRPSQSVSVRIMRVYVPFSWRMKSSWSFWAESSSWALELGNGVEGEEGLGSGEEEGEEGKSPHLWPRTLTFTSGAKAGGWEGEERE